MGGTSLQIYKILILNDHILLFVNKHIDHLDHKINNEL